MPSNYDARRLTSQRGRVRSQLKGAASTRKLIRQLPRSVKENMADILEEVKPQILADVIASAPERTGALKAALDAKVLRASLRLRVGLISRATAARLFYGRIIEFGRKAQTITVTRRAGTAPYKLRVRAMAARPFVYKKRPDLRSSLNQKLRGFWDATLADAAQGIGDD